MSYEPGGLGPKRDGINAAEIASERPALATRFHTSITPDPEESLRGGEHDESPSTAETRMNQWLRVR